MQRVLTIGGFDPTVGAGVLRDILTFRKLGVYGFAVVTAITYQNLNGFIGYRSLSVEDVERQISAITESNIKYVKISMVGSGEIARLLERKIEKQGWYVVFDPLLSAKNGVAINQIEDIQGLMARAKILVPNVPEAERISGVGIRNGENAIEAGRKIRERLGNCVIIKGGHLEGEDYLIGDEIVNVRMEHMGKVVHGTGCAYSSALTAYLARGFSLKKAFYQTRKFLQEEIKRSISLGGEYEVLP